ncbi:MAG TPA: DUF6789 family protein [Thermomicrobiales bacterium]|nr:DUF6789 family protein [Thermomicrobiales bacterium]
MHRLTRGALAGGAATLLMSVPIVAAEKLGFFQNPPPREISARAANRTDALPDSPEPAFSLVWPVAHLAYGTGVGAGFGLVRRMLPSSPVVTGLIVGGGVWAISYAGYLPALGLYPPPSDDSPPRPVTMIVAHAVYGIALARIYDRL